ILISVLEDPNQEPMVRHEAAEALGAIGSTKSINVLEKYKLDPVIEVAETCEIALDRIKWKKSTDEDKPLSRNPYNSIDPAPPVANENIQELESTLLNEKATLFDRYRAMFSLRNMRNDAATVTLGKALKHGSALFRHEIAFVLGQLQNEVSVPYLKNSLEDLTENE
nr:nero [Cucujiformia]